MREHLAAARVDYDEVGLDEAAAPVEPFTLFDQWYAAAAGVVPEPNAMVLATSAEGGRPSSRTVLLKGFDETGAVFFTNYLSAKGTALEASPGCALLFPWYALHRQVRLEGTAARVPREESEAYFSSRPRDAQLGAWASPQSEQVADRAALDALLAEVTERFDGHDVPCPPHWGGYRVSVESMEFWQGRKGRLHDRLLYTYDGQAWTRTRLAP